MTRFQLPAPEAPCHWAVLQARFTRFFVFCPRSRQLLIPGPALASIWRSEEGLMWIFCRETKWGLELVPFCSGSWAQRPAAAMAAERSCHRRNGHVKQLCLIITWCRPISKHTTESMHEKRVCVNGRSAHTRSRNYIWVMATWVWSPMTNKARWLSQWSLTNCDINNLTVGVGAENREAFPKFSSLWLELKQTATSLFFWHELIFIVD